MDNASGNDDDCDNDDYGDEYRFDLVVTGCAKSLEQLQKHIC